MMRAAVGRTCEHSVRANRAMQRYVSLLNDRGWAPVFQKRAIYDQGGRPRHTERHRNCGRRRDVQNINQCADWVGRMGADVSGNSRTVQSYRGGFSNSGVWPAG